MAALNAQLFRDYFSGSWIGSLSKNGEFLRHVTFNWPSTSGNYSSIGAESGLIVPTNTGALSNTNQISIAGWRSDLKQWCAVWYNEFGGYGELKWTSKEIENGKTTIFGTVHECKQEGDDPTDHSAICELIDEKRFKYSIHSFRKGLLEISASKILTDEELKEQMTHNKQT